MVFLFPLAARTAALVLSRCRLALDARARRRSRRDAEVVVPLAGVMLFGGLAGRGFDAARGASDASPSASGTRNSAATRRPRPITLRFPLEWGASGRLLVRRGASTWGWPGPCMCSIGGLHLGRWWTRIVPEQLVRAVHESTPDLILLGGDLADNRQGLPLLEACVRALKVEIAPVHAVPSNHDETPGLAESPPRRRGRGRPLAARPAH